MIDVEVVSARISAIAHATEDTRKVVHALVEICFPDKFHPKVEKQVVKGHFGNAITRIDFVVHMPWARSFFEVFWSRLSHLDRETVLGELGNRIDGEGRMYVRIDKQECFVGNLHLRDQDPIKVQIALRREPGFLKEVKLFLESI